jgi:hypothetical protein
MTSESDFIQPPRIAAFLVNLFAPAERAESLVGDLLEEFIHHAHKSGIAVARRWYWRQTAKSIAFLMLTAFRGAPWAMVAAIVGGFFAHRLVHEWPGKALSAITDKYLWYWSSHFEVYTWVLNGMALVHLIGSVLVGCVVALAAKGKEMIATMTLALIFFAMFVVGYIEWVAVSWPNRDSNLEWSILMWQSLGFLAILVGGAIVRIVRSPATIQFRPAHRAGN